MNAVRLAVGVALRLVLSGVFVYAGWVKLVDPAEFRGAVESFRIVPQGLLSFVVYGIPAAEIVLAVGLWLKRYRDVAAWACAVLMAVFTVLIGVAWIRGIDLTCGCFGSAGGNETNYPFLLVRDLALLGVALVVWRFPCRSGDPR